MVEGRALTHAPTRNSLRGLDAIGVALLGALGLFLAWPIARLLTRALSRRGVTEIVADERIRGVAWFSLWQATASLVAVFALALPVAAVLARYEFKGRRAVLALASLVSVVMARRIARLLGRDQ